MADSSEKPDGGVAPSPAGDDCPLPVDQQRKNLVLFGSWWSLFYLSAAVSYVGVTHANLLKELGSNDKIANLPGAAYQWMTALPILVAWFFPQPRLTKPLLIGSVASMGTLTGAVALALWLELPKFLWTTLIVAHGAVFGAGAGLAIPSLWEIARRGISSSRRGKVLGLAFGAGPVFAFAGSLAQQLILTGEAHGWTVSHFPFPGNYTLLFAAATPLLLLAALLSAAFVVPAADGGPENASRGGEILRGMQEFIASRPLVLGVAAYVLVYSGGNAIMATVSMMAGDIVATAGGTVGYQNELRFGFKAVAGGLLGWLLSQTHPKAALLATTLTLLVAVSWALAITGPWYLMSMGLLGAGELFGAYFPNYIASASRKTRVRLNIAYLTLVGALAGFASLIFGAISDTFNRRTSLYAAIGVLVATLLLITLTLPADPRPNEEAEERP